MKKRSIALILLVLMICSLLAGCMKNAEAVNFAGDIDLGEDGVITKDVFSQLRDSGEIASICGKSGEISYKWTVPGTEVTNPQDLCMAVAITEKTDGSVETRARRRYDELQEKGVSCDLEEIKADIRERDERDMTRETAPLRQADDAVLIDSSDMTIPEVTAAIAELCK